MHEQDDEKKDAAWLISDAFLDRLYRDPLFVSRYDRGMAVMVLVARFICMEEITPSSYLKWLRQKVVASLIEEPSPEAAEAARLAEERRRKACH